MEVAADGDASGNSQRPHALKKIPYQHLRRPEQTLCTCDVDDTEESRIFTTIFDARREPTCTLKQNGLQRHLLFVRTGQHDRRGESIDLDSRHAVRHAEKTRLRIEPADLLQWRLPLHHDTWLVVQLWPETQERLPWKLPGIETGVEFCRLVHRAPAHAV